MTSYHQVLAAIQANVASTLLTAGVPANSGIGWPPQNTLQDVSRGNPSVVAVYNRRISRNVTRWMPYDFNLVLVPPTMTVALTGGSISLTQHVTLTLGGSPTLGDAVGAVFYGVGPPIFGADLQYHIYPSWGATAVYRGTPESLTTVAAGLAATINADPYLSLIVSAWPVGPTVTLTGIGTRGPVRVKAFVGNGGSAQREVGRREHQIQIAAWSQTEPLRELLVPPLDALIAVWEATFSLLSIDGSPLRVVYVNDFDIEDATLQDVYRHDFFFTVEYPVTVVDRLYTILAPQEDLVPAYSLA